MARLIVDESYPTQVSSLYSWWQVGAVGLGAGLLYLLLTWLLGQFVIDPIFCGTAYNSQICGGSTEISGNIANVLVTVVGLGALIRLGVLRPLVIALATGICVWGLAGWTEGLGWGEVAAWTLAIFGLSYLAFSWISRHTHSLTVLIASLVIVILARIAVIL